MWPWVGKGTEVLIQGIEFDRFDAAADARQRIRRELGIPHDAVVAVSVANLRRPKDYPNLLRATGVARLEIPNFTVLVLGQGPLKEEIEGLHAELGLGDSVRFLGFRSDVADILAASDIFVIASAYEGGPLSLIEAMRSGLPSVATDVGFVSDVIEPGVHGLIVPTRNHRELAKAFVTLCRDGDARAAMGRAARSVSGRFDIRETVERQMEVYRQLAGKASSLNTSRND